MGPGTQGRTTEIALGKAFTQQWLAATCKDLSYKFPTGGVDLQRMKLASMGGRRHRGRFFLGAISPRISWTRGSGSTSDCCHGPFSAPEHAS
jgi:hypothetical protein